MRLMTSPRLSRPPKNLALISALCLAAAPLRAQELPDGIKFVPAFGTDGSNGFVNPGFMIEIPGKPGHFAVAEMGNGKLWVLAPNGAGFTKTLFVTVPVNTSEQDMGLTGVAFHPDYAANGKYYVKRGLPGRPPRQNVLEERIAAPDRLKDGGGAARRLITFDMPNEFNDHNGGSPVFGPDGYLYLGLGDGGWDLNTPDVHKHGQNLKSLLGKIIRIDVNKKDAGLEYGIPADNPFAGNADPAVRKEIWAYGLRNPYRLTFDRLTKELYAGDVGWIKFDEVNIIKKGGNYGWSVKEGSFCLPNGPCDGVATPIEEPALYLQNGGGANMLKCVIGGEVYRGDPASPFYGAYLFGDYTLKRAFGFRKSANGAAVRTAKDYGNAPMEPIGFTQDAQSNLYMVGHLGVIYKLEHAQLKPVTVGLAAAAGRPAPGLHAAFATRGRIALPTGLRGEFAAFTPAGRLLGRVIAGGNAQGTSLPGADGLVLLRPIRSP